MSPREIEERRQSVSKRRPSQAAIEFMSRSERDISTRRQAEEDRAKQALEKQRRQEEQEAVNGRPAWNSDTAKSAVRCSKLPSKSSIDHRGHRSELSESEPKRKQAMAPDSTPGAIPGLRSDSVLAVGARKKASKTDEAIASRLLSKAREREARLDARRGQAQV